MKDLEKVIVAGLLSVFSVATFSKDVEESKTDGDSCYSIADVQDYSYWGNVELIATCVLGQEAPALGATDSVSQAASAAGITGENIEVGRGETSSFEPQAATSNNTVAVASLLPAGDSADSGDGLTSSESPEVASDQPTVADSNDGLISIDQPEVGDGGNVAQPEIDDGGAVTQPEVGDGENVVLPEVGDGGSVAQPEIVEEELELHIDIPERDYEGQYVGYQSAYNFVNGSGGPNDGCNGYGTCFEGAEVGAVVVNAEDNSEIDEVEDRIALRAYSASGNESYSHTFDENYNNTPFANLGRSRDTESVSVTFDDTSGIVAEKNLIDVEGTVGQPGYLRDAKVEKLQGEGGDYNYTNSDGSEQASIRLLYAQVSDLIAFQSDDVALQENSSLREFVVSDTLTPLSDIQDLINSSATGVYHGESNRWQQQVDIEVDFGAEKFVANVGNSPVERHIGNFYYFSESSSFSASGDIRGAHLVSTSVSATDSNDVSGILQGSFVSEKADGIIGAYDVTKNGTQIADTFATVREGLVEVNQ